MHIIKFLSLVGFMPTKKHSFKPKNKKKQKTNLLRLTEYSRKKTKSYLVSFFFSTLKICCKYAKALLSFAQLKLKAIILELHRLFPISGRGSLLGALCGATPYGNLGETIALAARTHQRLKLLFVNFKILIFSLKKTVDSYANTNVFFLLNTINLRIALWFKYNIELFTELRFTRFCSISSSLGFHHRWPYRLRVRKTALSVSYATYLSLKPSLKPAKNAKSTSQGALAKAVLNSIDLGVSPRDIIFAFTKMTLLATRNKQIFADFLPLDIALAPLKLKEEKRNRILFGFLEDKKKPIAGYLNRRPYRIKLKGPFGLKRLIMMLASFLSLVVNKILLKWAQKKHKKLPKHKVINKYWVFLKRGQGNVAFAYAKATSVFTYNK